MLDLSAAKMPPWEKWSAGSKKQAFACRRGFATTGSAFRYFIEHNNLATRIKAQLDAMAAKRATLDETGRTIRELFLQSEFPQEVAGDIRAA